MKIIIRRGCSHTKTLTRQTPSRLLTYSKIKDILEGGKNYYAYNEDIDDSVITRSLKLF
ncbi:MAG: hypothetical protein ABI675_14900 [Chitinophagaceae bacterium]